MSVVRGGSGFRRACARRPVVAIVVLAMVAAVGGVRAEGADAPSVVVTVSPGDGLVDGQEITVTGTGTMPPSDVDAVLCPAGETECWTWLGSDEASPDGFSLTGRVRALIGSAGSDALVDCRTSSCEVVVSTWDHESGDDAELARVPVTFDPVAPLLDPPSLAVDPDQDLVDGQTVLVSGAGHRPMSTVWIQQCAPEDDLEHDCRMIGTGFADGSGHFTASAAVRATLPGGFRGSGERLDCRTVTCRVLAASSWGSAAAPVTFDPASPVPPGPTIVVSPATDIADGATVAVTGQGFTPRNMVDLQLCAVSSGRCDITGDVYVESQDDGTVVAEMVVYQEIADHDGFVDCAVAPGCEVRARDWEASEVARAPVSFRPTVRPSVRYLDPVFPEVEVLRGVVYRHTTDVDGNDVELALDIYLPVGDTAAKRPTAMWMFGGWFMFGDREQLAAYAMDSARRGYVGVAIDYRIRPDLDLADLLDAAADAEADARAAIDWLKAHAAEYRLDPDAIVAGGVSAGAVLAWNLAYGADDAAPGPSPVAAVVPISGVPLSGPEVGAPPAIAFHAVDDEVLPIGPDRETCPLAAGVGAVCELVEMPDGGHYIAESHVRQIVGTTYAFLADHVLRPLGYFAPVRPVPIGPPVRPELYPGPPGATAPTAPSPTPTSAATTVPPTTAPDPDGPAVPPSPPPTAPRPPAPTPTSTGPAEAGAAAGRAPVPGATAAEPREARPRYAG